MLSAILGENRDIFFPKLDTELHMLDFRSIAERYLESRGLRAYQCESEDEARSKVFELKKKNQWPCFFTESNTTGEKAFEEFFTTEEEVLLDKFKEIGVVKNEELSQMEVDHFLNNIDMYLNKGTWTKQELVNEIVHIVPELKHEERGFYLDGKM